MSLEQGALNLSKEAATEALKLYVSNLEYFMLEIAERWSLVSHMKNAVRADLELHIFLTPNGCKRFSDEIYDELGSYQNFVIYPTITIAQLAKSYAFKILERELTIKDYKDPKYDLKSKRMTELFRPEDYDIIKEAGNIETINNIQSMIHVINHCMKFVNDNGMSISTFLGVEDINLYNNGVPVMLLNALRKESIPWEESYVAYLLTLTKNYRNIYSLVTDPVTKIKDIANSASFNQAIDHVKKNKQLPDQL